MLTIYDLYDLHYIYCCIRLIPENELNRDIISKVIGVLKDGHDNNETNQFRNALQSIKLLNTNSLYSFVYTNNIYSYYPSSFIKDGTTYSLLLLISERLQKRIVYGNKDDVYNYADYIHNIPLVIAENSCNASAKYLRKELKRIEKDTGLKIEYKK